MLAKFSGSRQGLQFVLLLGILLGVLGISLFLAVSMESVVIHLGDTYRIIFEQIHTSLQKRYPNGQFVFDPYGHHEQVAERFLAFSSWLVPKWKIK